MNYAAHSHDTFSLVLSLTMIDKWQQAYRFLGGVIDCSNSWGGGSQDSGGGGGGDGACSRWMMWAAVSLCLFVFCGEPMMVYDWLIVSSCGR